MGMQLPEWARKMFQITTGDGWPEADEDALWALAREWAAVGGAIGTLQYQLMQPVRGVRRSDWDGPAARAFALAGEAPAGRQLAGLATGSHDVSDFIHQTGVNVQYMKIIVIEELVLLAAQISQLLWLSGATFGASLAGIPGLAALGRMLARLATYRLGMWIMSLVMGEAMQLALDSIAQAAQMAAGTRRHWEKALTANAAITGGVSGVLGPIAQGAAGRLFNPERVKGALGRDLTAGLRQVAGSAAHEYFTSGVTGVVTRQGWTGSPWDLTAGATEGTVEALTQLRHRRGGLPPTGVLRHLEALPHLDTMPQAADAGPHAPDAGPHAATSADNLTGGFTPRDVPPTGGTGTPTGGERLETGVRADQTYVPQDVPHWSAAVQTAPESTSQPTGASQIGQQPDASRTGQQPASEAVSGQGTSGLPPQRQAGNGGARRQARDGTSLVARLRGEHHPQQHPPTSNEDHSSTPVEVHSRSGGQPPIRHSHGTPGDKPLRRLSTRTPQMPTATHTAQSPDARPSAHVNTAHVNTTHVNIAGPETSPTRGRQHLAQAADNAALTEDARRVAKAEAYALAMRLGLVGDGPEAERAREVLSDRLAEPVWALLDDAHRFTEADHARVARIKARQAWEGTGLSVAGLVDRAASVGELYQAGVRPHEIAGVATPAALRRLFPGSPGLSEVQAGELAELLRDPGIGQMLDETWGGPAATPPILAEALLAKLGGHPELVHAMIQLPELRYVLAGRPETLDHLANHRAAIDAVCSVVEDIRTRGAKAVLADGIAQPAPTPLTDQQRAISQALRPAQPVWYQDGFDAARRGDPAYREAYMGQLYEAAYGPDHVQGTIAEDSVQGELTRIAHDIAEKTGGEAAVRSRPKDARRAQEKIAVFGNRADGLLDLAGGRISYDRLSDLYEALEMISRHPGLTIVALNDGFLRPTPAGYRDVQMNVRFSSGHIGELQLHLKSMAEVLAWEHSLDEIERDLNTLEQQRPLNRVENAIRLSVVREAQEAFWDALQPALTREHRSPGGESPGHHRETTADTPTTTEAPVTVEAPGEVEDPATVESPGEVEDPATVENSIITEDGRALHDYSRVAHAPLNRYLRNPIHYTTCLASAMVMAIEERILEGVDEVGGERFADDLEALGQVSTRAAMIWRQATAIAVEIATEMGAPRTSAAISAGAEIRMEEIRFRISARREEILALADEVVAEIGAGADRVSEALYRLPPSPGTTFRGSLHPEDVLAHYTPGHIITESAFTSTSRDLEPVLKLSRGGNVLFEITGTSGRDISSYSFLEAEKEVLYDKGTYFQVVSRTWVADLDRWWIVMREVPASRLGQHPGGPQAGEAESQADSPAPDLIDGCAADGAPAERAPELSELAERAYDAALTENARRVAKAEAYGLATRLGLTGDDEGATFLRVVLRDTFTESTRRLLDDARWFTEADHARVARIEARRFWADVGVSVAELVDRASSVGELYQTGVRPHEIARLATPAVLSRLFPGLPGLSEVQTRELAELLRDPQIGQMLADTWGSPADTPPILAEALLAKLGGQPALVHAMIQVPELRHALAARPETIDHLAGHRTAIDALSAVVEDIRTRGVQAVLADGVAQPAPTPLTERQRAISAAARQTEPLWCQDGFDRSRRDDPAYRQAYLHQLYEAAYGPDYAQGTIADDSAQGELARIAIVIADLTDGAPAMRLQPKDPRQAWSEIGGFGNRADELLDLARVKISFDRLSDLYVALELISCHPGLTFVAFHDRFVTPTLAGYRDVQISVRTSNGHIGELQLRLKSMDDVMMWKHTLDQIQRDVTTEQEERPLKPIEEAMLLGIVREAQRAFWDALQLALTQEGQQATSRRRIDHRN